MAIGRDERRNERRSRVAAAVPSEDVEATLDLLALVDFAWHDCYGETTPAAVIDQVLIVGRGRLRELVQAAQLAVIDRRDLQVAAEAIVGHRPAPEP